jgi:hypothetical protein
MTESLEGGHLELDHDAADAISCAGKRVTLTRGTPDGDGYGERRISGPITRKRNAVAGVGSEPRQVALAFEGAHGLADRRLRRPAGTCAPKEERGDDCEL